MTIAGSLRAKILAHLRLSERAGIVHSALGRYIVDAVDAIDDSLTSGESFERFPTEAALLSASSSDGAGAFAEDTERHFVRQGSTWQQLVRAEAGSRTLAQIVADIGSAERTIILGSSISMGGASVTVPSTMRLQFLDGGRIVIGANQTLTLEGPIVAGVQQIFDYGSETTSVLIVSKKARVPMPVEWFGAKGDGVTDDIVAIRRASRVAGTANEPQEIVFQSGRHYWCTDTWQLGVLGQATTSYTIRGMGAYLLFDGVVLGAKVAVKVGQSTEYQTTIAAGSHGAALPQATIHVTSTADLPASGIVRILVDPGNEQTIAYTGKTAGGDPTITGCTGGTGTLSTGDTVYSHVNVNPALSTKIHRLDWHGLNVERFTVDAGVESIGLGIAACDHSVFRDIAVNGFYWNYKWIEEGGNGNLFDHCHSSAGVIGARIGGLGATTSVIDAYNGNVNRWIGGKIQQCDLGMHLSGVNLVVENVDLSICEMAIFAETLGQARLQFYAEACGTNAVGQTGAVLQMTDCRAVDVTNSWLNATGNANGHDCGYGLRMTRCDHVDVRGNTFNRARLADLRIDSDCGQGIVIHESNYAEPATVYQTGKKPRVADFRPARVRNDVRTRDLPRTSFDALHGEPINVLQSPDAFDHPSWTLTNATIGASTLAPDGTSLAQIVRFTSADDVSTLALTQQPEMGVGDLDGYEIVLRYWWKPWEVEAVSALAPDFQFLRSDIIRESTPGDQSLYDSSGAFQSGGGAGDWQFEEHVYAVPSSSTGSKLFRVAFRAPYEGVSVALWGVQLFARLPVNARAHVPAAGVAPATALVAGPMSSSDKANIDALVAGGVRRTRTRRIQHSELTAAATSESLNVGPPLPADARILGFGLPLGTPFSGGGAGSCTISVGTDGDDDALIAGANVFAAAVDGMASTMPLGIAPFKQLGGQQLKAKVTSNVNVADLTAGDVTVEVAYTSQLGGSLFEFRELEGCSLWLPSDASSKTIVSGKVSAWADASASALSAAQSTPGLRPVNVPIDPCCNRLNTVAWDGIDDLLSLATGATVGSLIAATGFSVFALVVLETSPVNDVHQKNAAIISDSVGFWDVSTTSAGQFGAGTYDGAHDGVYTSVQFGRRAVVEAHHDGSTLRVQVNGGAEATVAQGSSVGAGNAVTLIGRAGETTTTYLRFRMAELAVYKRHLTPEQKALCRGRLNVLGAVY